MEKVSKHLEEKIWDQVSRILDSPTFIGSIILRDFLNFIVEETLHGREDGLKEYVIATNVLKKEEDFNPQVSAIVRIHARRLRMKLDEYYMQDGVKDPIRITVPKGRYKPVFESNFTRTVKDSKDVNRERPVEENRPVIAVLPCVILNHSEHVDAVSSVLSRDLSIALTKAKELAVLPHNSAKNAYEKLGNYKDFGVQMEVDYILIGTCSNEEDKIKCTIELIALHNLHLLWAESFYLASGTRFDAQAYRNIIRKVIAMTCGYRGLIYQDMFKISEPQDFGQYYALYWHDKYHKKFSEIAFHEAMNAVNMGLESNPDNALLLAFKGEIILNLSLMDLDRKSEHIKNGTKIVEEAIGMNQDCQHCYQVMLWANVLQHDKEEALRSMEKMLAINPNDVMYLSQAGFGCICIGEYERGLDMMSEALSLNPHYPWDINVGFALYYIINKEYKEALYWAKIISRKSMVWDPILRCCSLGYLGRKEDALETYNEILALVPDFPEKAESIVGTFLLDKNLQGSILHGLSLANVHLKQVLNS